MNDSLIGHILVRLVFGKACLPRVLGMLIKISKIDIRPVRLPVKRGKQGTPAYGLKKVDQEFRIDIGPLICLKYEANNHLKPSLSFK